MQMLVNPDFTYDFGYGQLRVQSKCGVQSLACSDQQDARSNSALRHLDDVCGS